MKLEKITLKNSEKILLLGNLSTMMKSGIMIVETVDSLLEDAKGNLKIVLESVRKDIMQGKRVNFAFSRFPSVFDKITINVLKASEEAGKLHTALKDLKDNLRKQIEFMNKVKFALLYPAVVIVLFISMFVMILTFVIPRFSQVFKQLHVKLPLPTQILFALSYSFTTYMLYYIIAIILIFFLIVFFYSRYRQKMVQFVTSLPLIKDIIIKIDLTRFAYNLHVLLDSGISIVIALDLLKDIVINKEVAKILENARKGILAGKRFSEGLKTDKKIVPPIVVKLIEAGEITGSLHQAMKDVSEYLDYEVVTSLQVLTSLLEPIILVIVGLTIGGMMIAIITPIYQIIGQIGSH